jgi:hypothetical protein
MSLVAQPIASPASDAQVTEEDLIDMAISDDAEAAAMERHYPQIISSSALDKALPLAAAELKHQADERELLGLRTVQIDDSAQSQDEEDLFDLAADMAEQHSQSRRLFPLVARSSSKSVASVSHNRRKPVSWLAVRNIQWKDEFYDEMYKVLRNGVPQSKSEKPNHKKIELKALL